MKSPEELGITQAELDALLKVRGMLADGTITHRGNDDFITVSANTGGLFNMEYTCNDFACGTVGCIGGWMHILMLGIKPIDGVYNVPARDDISKYVYGAENTRPIGDLFFPPRRFQYSAITDANALQAIDNFLTTGKPDWQSFLHIEDEDYEDDDE